MLGLIDKRTHLGQLFIGEEGRALMCTKYMGPISFHTNDKCNLGIM